MFFDRLGCGLPANDELGLRKNNESHCAGGVNDDGTRTCLPKFLIQKMEKLANKTIKDPEVEYMTALELAKTNREIRQYYHEFFKVSTDLAEDGPITDKHIAYIYNQWEKEMKDIKFKHSNWIPPDYMHPDFPTIVKNVPALVDYIGENCVFANPVNLQEEYSNPKRGLAHWTLLTVDTREEPYNITYFCSLGEPIPNQILKLISEIEHEYKARGHTTKFYPLNKIKHQKYGSSCGIYLFYIVRCMIYKGWRGKDFAENAFRITEPTMEEFRKYVFDDTYKNIVSETGSRSLLR